MVQVPFVIHVGKLWTLYQFLMNYGDIFGRLILKTFIRKVLSVQQMESYLKDPKIVKKNNE